MKILSKEEFKKELDEILTYDANDIIIDTEDIKNIGGDNIFAVECLDLDIEDINIITNNKDLLVMSASEQCGFNSMLKAIKLAVSDFEENKLSLIEADGILVYFQVNSNYNMMDFAEAMEIIHDSSSRDIYLTEEPDVIFGVSCNDNLEDNYVKVTVFISYSKQKKGSYANNYKV